MRYGLRLPTFALGAKTATLQEMGAYLRRAEDLGFESGMVIDHLLVGATIVDREIRVARLALVGGGCEQLRVVVDGGIDVGNVESELDSGLLTHLW